MSDLVPNEPIEPRETLWPRVSDGIFRFAIACAAIAVVLAAARAASGVILPLLLAAFLTVLAAPVQGRLAKRLPRWLAVTLTIAVLVLVLACATFVVVRSVDEFVGAVPRYQVGFAARVAELQTWAARYGVAGTGDASLMSLLSLTTSLVSGSANAVVGIVVVVLIAAFMLVEATSIEHKLERILPNPEENLSRAREAAAQVQKYLVVKTVLNAATAGFFAIVGVAFRLDFTLLWTVLAFVLNFAPTIGAFLSLVPPVAIALVEYGPRTAVLTAIVLSAINFVVGNIIEPRVIGRALHLSPLAVLASVIFWGWLWGPVGALLAVPLTVSVKVFLARSRSYHWVALLLGPADENDAARRTPSPS